MKISYYFIVIVCISLQIPVYASYPSYPSTYYVHPQYGYMAYYPTYNGRQTSCALHHLQSAINLEYSLARSQGEICRQNYVQMLIAAGLYNYLQSYNFGRMVDCRSSVNCHVYQQNTSSLQCLKKLKTPKGSEIRETEETKNELMKAFGLTPVSKEFHESKEFINEIMRISDQNHEENTSPSAVFHNFSPHNVHGSYLFDFDNNDK